jgi:hypothetical protein
MLSKPTRRARAYVSSVSATVCPRFKRRSIASSNACAPMLRPIHPQRAQRAQFRFVQRARVGFECDFEGRSLENQKLEIDTRK